MKPRAARSGSRRYSAASASTSSVAVVLVIVLLLAAGAAVFLFSRPPGTSPAAQSEAFGSPVSLLREGALPGVTWADDVHPIFVRNGCGQCHTRGSEAYVSGEYKYSLGFIDPANPNNPYWSYHELVYGEGKELVQQGETLRDGQSDWPRGMSSSQQRRIWLGHPERSVIMRKLDHDYFSWTQPPRYTDEALRLTWGAPMPFFDGLLNPAKGDRTVRTLTLPELMLHQVSLWLGPGRGGYHILPSRISPHDRAILRHWIENVTVLGPQGAQIDVSITDFMGNPVPGAKVLLVGDYNNPERQDVTDRIEVPADDKGQARITFTPGSVISSRWYISAETATLGADYRGFIMHSGDKLEYKIVVLTKAASEDASESEPVSDEE